eukprot:s301_g16.t1
MSEKLKELQQGLKESGVGWLRARVKKVRVDALRSLASELGLSVEGISVKRDFESLVCVKLEVQDAVERLRSVVQKGGTQMLWKELKALKVGDRRDRCKELGVSQTVRIGCEMGGSQCLIDALQPRPEADEEEVRRLDEHVRALAVVAGAVAQANAATTPKDALIRAIWQELRPQDGGETDFDAVAKLEELRVNAGIKGMAWLQKEVHGMEQKDLRKDGGEADFDALANLEELRVNAGRKGMSWLQKEVGSMKRDLLRKLAAAAGLKTHGSGTSMVSVDDSRTAIIKHVAPQAGRVRRW